MNQHDVLAALLRSDLRFFIRKVFHEVEHGKLYLPNWNVDAIVHQLMLVQSGKVTRLLVNQPPRSLKSICISVAFVAWLLGHDPAMRIIVASYSQDFAAELHRQFRRVIDSSWYRALFPRMRAAKDSGTELITTAGGSRFATSVGGTLTGRGADLIIVDDPLKADEGASESARKRVIEWFSGSLVTRLNHKATSKMVVVMQRLHEEDLAGHLIQQGGWDHLNLPAIATEPCIIPIGRGKTITRCVGDVLHPERESREALDSLKVSIGSLRFSAQYQQQPVPVEGNLIKRIWFRTYSKLPLTDTTPRVVQSWDIAASIGQANDYSVCTTWRMMNRDYYLIDVFRARLEYPDLRRAVANLAGRHNAGTVLIEDAGLGMLLVQDLRNDTPSTMPRPIGRKPEGGKVERMAAQSASIEAGQVHLPDGASWLDDFLIELLAFPQGRHDDQVDSVAQFLAWAAERKSFSNQFHMYIDFVGREDGDVF